MNPGATFEGDGSDKRHSRAVRDRLLDVADELFYQQGVRAVGVDLIVQRSGVAKTSLYRHFASKDDLVAAVLERHDKDYWDQWNKTALDEASDPRAELEAHLRWIAEEIAGPNYRGCPFLNVATEFTAQGHPGRVVATRHKLELHRRLVELTKRIGIVEPERLADQLVLLIDGAYVNGQLFGVLGPAQALVAAALALVPRGGHASTR